MSPKKSKRSQAAQQLIENLLDEMPPAKSSALDFAQRSDPPVDPTADQRAPDDLTFDGAPVDDSDLPSHSHDDSPASSRSIKVFDGTQAFRGTDEIGEADEPNAANGFVIEDDGEEAVFQLDNPGQRAPDEFQIFRAEKSAKAQEADQRDGGRVLADVATRIVRSEKSEPSVPTRMASKTTPQKAPEKVAEKSTEKPTERSSERPPFEGTSPVVTKMAQRAKIVRPPDDEVVKEVPRDADETEELEEIRKRRKPDVDFGEMSAEDPFAGDLQAPSAPEPSDERTVRVPASTLVSEPEPRSEVIPISRSIDRGGATEIRPGVKIPPSPKLHPSGVGGGAPYTSVEASLKQSESLRIAQNRISELERELERVRRDNEALSTAGDTLRRRTDELTGKAEALEIQAREASIRLEEEKKIMRGQLQQKDRENSEMRARVEEIETRLESNFKKIRVRERELEHRLEIVKMESATLVSTKDKMLLDLKRQIDQLHQESDSAKSKSQELFSQYKEKQETIRRVVRALRIALTILEGDDETVVPLKKAE